MITKKVLLTMDKEQAITEAVKFIQVVAKELVEIYKRDPENTVVNQVAYTVGFEMGFSLDDLVDEDVILVMLGAQLDS